jgi:sigma-B regulation protein RsbU (phosphoserine phosphatase)
MLCLEQGGDMRAVASRVDTPVDPGLPRQLAKLQVPTKAGDLTRKADAPLKAALENLRLEAVVPLQIQGQTKGILALGERLRGGGYTRVDLEFVASLGHLAMISLENARLFHDAIERQKLEDDLVIAKEIQQGLLPSELPAIPHFDVAAVNISSKQVGGDYYDIIPLRDDTFVLAIGDVSGKGTPASLLMANLQATIRALGPLDHSLADLTQRVNDLISENTSGGRFITFFWGILDCRAMTLTYVNAGHNPPFLFRDGGAVERLDQGGIILGIMKTVRPYQQATVRLAAGDVLVLFTDGVSEAMNHLDEEWGEERLQVLGGKCKHCTAQETLAAIVEAVRAHSSATPQSDDITLLVGKVTA